MRDAIGPNVDLMADCYMGWNLEYAKRMLRALEPQNLRWVEEVMVADDLGAYAELQAQRRIKLKQTPAQTSKVEGSIIKRGDGTIISLIEPVVAGGTSLFG